MTALAFFVLCFSIFEFMTHKNSTTEGITLIIEALTGIVLVYLPNIAKMTLHIQFSSAVMLFYWFFLVIAVFLGTGLHVIRYVSFWDKILHLVSPILLTAIGYGLLATLLKDAKIENTSPWLFLVFGFAFAGTCGVFWEFWEFFCDQFFGMNLQRFATSAGIIFSGRKALLDTMGDLLTNTAGAVIMMVFAYLKSRNNPGFFHQFKIKRVRPSL